MHESATAASSPNILHEIIPFDAVHTHYYGAITFIPVPCNTTVYIKKNATNYKIVHHNLIEQCTALLWFAFRFVQ